MKELRVATFNVRGATKDYKKENLATDLERYKVDICCLQETKIRNGCDEEIKGHRMICLPTNNVHYGMGFIIHEKWKRCVHKVWKVDDRIAVLQVRPEDNKRQQNDMPRITKSEGLKMTFKLRSGKEKTENYKVFRRNMKMKFVKGKKHERHQITIINVYGPHSERTKDRPEELEKFYDKLEQVMESTKKEPLYS